MNTIDEYISTATIAALWGVSKRRIVQLCLEDKIMGAKRMGRVWMIPSNAQKPIDARIKTRQYIMPQLEEAVNKIVNRIFEADCLKKMPMLPAQSIDMILCDLPYGITQNNWDSFVSLEALWKEYLRIIKPNGVIALTSQGAFTAKLIMSQEKLFRYKWVWEKSKPTNFLNAKKQPLRKHEDICIFYENQPKYNPQMTCGEPYDKGIRKNQYSGNYGEFGAVHVQSQGERYPTDVIYIKTAESEGAVVHPTQKPVELGRYLIRTYTDPGDIVLDNTFGSGSFLVAAIMEGRNFIGIEKNSDVALFKKYDVDYIDLAKKRLREAWLELPQGTKKYLHKSPLLDSFES